VNADAVPVIETARLRVQGPRKEDFAAFAAMWARPEVTKEISGEPLPPEESWRRLLRNAGLWPVCGYGYWHVFERESGAFVGQVGFADFQRELTPPLTGMPEIGWAISPDYQGKGYATEAALGAIQWGDKVLSAERMSCIIGVNNAPSIRIAEKCGFSFATTTEYHGSVIKIYHRPIAGRS